MKKIFKIIKKALGLATDIADETGKGGKVKEILDTGRALGWWDEHGVWHPAEEKKEVLH